MIPGSKDHLPRRAGTAWQKFLLLEHDLLSFTALLTYVANQMACIVHARVVVAQHERQHRRLSGEGRNPYEATAALRSNERRTGQPRIFSTIRTWSSTPKRQSSPADASTMLEL